MENESANHEPPNLNNTHRNAPVSLGNRLRSELGLKLFLLVTLNLWVFLPYHFLQQHHFFAATAMPSFFLDRAIPFIPQAVWAYLSVYILMPGGPFLMDSRRQILRYAAGIILIGTVADAVFLFWPTYCARPAVAESNALYRALITIDNPFDAFPSLHAAFAVYSAGCGTLVLRDLRRSWGWSASLWLWAGLILFATLATKQHVMVDIAAGGILGFGTYRWMFPARPPRFHENTSPAPAPDRTIPNSIKL